MYDVRRTMYDLDYSARCAGEGRVGAVSAYGRREGAARRGENWRLPMYDVGCTMYDLGSSRALRGKLAKPWTQLCIIQHLSNYHLA